MTDPERFDLSPLDPGHDPGRWDAHVAETLSRVDAVMRDRADAPLDLIGGWMKPVLLAAAAVLALLIPVEVALEQRENRLERVAPLVALSADWVPTGSPPSGADFVRALARRSR